MKPTSDALTRQLLRLHTQLLETVPWSHPSGLDRCERRVVGVRCREVAFPDEIFCWKHTTSHWKKLGFKNEKDVKRQVGIVAARRRLGVRTLEDLERLGSQL